jgi:hypothetical protein
MRARPSNHRRPSRWRGLRGQRRRRAPRARLRDRRAPLEATRPATSSASRLRPSATDARCTSATWPACCTPCTAATAPAAGPIKTGSEIKSSPVLVDGLVLVGSYDANLYALDAATGAERWTVDRFAGARHSGRLQRPGVHRGVRQHPPCRATDRRRRGLPDRHGRLHRRLARHPRRPRLRRHLQRRGAGVRPRSPRASSGATPIPTAGSLSTPLPRSTRARGASSSAGATGTFTPSTPKTGEAAWTFATRARVDSSPVVAGGRVYVGSSDHRLYVLDVETGTEGLGVRHGRGHHGLPRRGRRPGRHRGRTACTTG